MWWGRIDLLYYNSMLMLGRKYDEIADTQSEPLFLHSSHSFPFHLQSLTPFNNGDFYSRDIGTIFKHHFAPAPYPPSRHSNPFCPYCLRFVAPQQPFEVSHQPLFQKTYLAHAACLAGDTSNCLNSIVEEINHASLALANGASEKSSISIGEKEYYVELQLGHSLTNHKYFTLKKKINSNGAHLIWNFKKYNQPSSYFPNIIAFPYPDFDLTLSLTKITDKTHKIKTRSFVNIQKLKCDGDRLVRITTDEFDLLVNIINTREGKESIVREMNFKYNHPIDIDYPLIQLVKLQMKLSSAESQDEEEYICSRENSSITQLLNQSTSQVSARRSNGFFQPQEKSCRSEGLGNSLLQRQKIDLQRLISNNLLGQYVRSNIQSRNFQAYLSDVGPEQLDKILQTLSPEFCQLVTHQYANYMMQKLFKICNEGQRLFILQKLLPNLPSIAMNKQGTHTLQALVALFTHQKQYQLTVQKVCGSLPELAFHNNATHFVQKIIDLFPVHLAATIYSIAAQHFVEFSLNKNAMCVIKHMMRKVKQIQDKLGTSDDPLMKEIKKSFLNPLLMNFNRIIQDAFGNYVVQFCYECFGDCMGITDYIIERFPQYSIQKYSGSVVLKCLQTYWTHKQTIQRLKSILNQNSVLDMYRSKEGNKILLTIMERFEGTLVRERIYGQLLMAQPSKFLQDRWGVALGCRSGTVGTYYNSFSEATKPIVAKKKKNYNIIQ